MEPWSLTIKQWWSHVDYKRITLSLLLTHADPIVWREKHHHVEHSQSLRKKITLSCSIFPAFFFRPNPTCFLVSWFIHRIFHSFKSCIFLGYITVLLMVTSTFFFNHHLWWLNHHLWWLNHHLWWLNSAKSTCSLVKSFEIHMFLGSITW
jgi:hypothetical protein